MLRQQFGISTKHTTSYNGIVFPGREALKYYDFGTDADQEWLVDEIANHWWAPCLEFYIQWTYGDTTWEPLAQVKDLEALDRYLELQGITATHQLSQ